MQTKDYSLDEQDKLTRQFEGLNLKPYRDSVGKWTIGIGRNLTDKGLSKQEVNYLFRNDLLESLACAKNYEFWEDLDATRKLIIVDMIFNLGPQGFSTFQGLIKALINKDYDLAANHMEKSLWYLQVKSRAIKLVKIMRMGKLEA